jgi:hypothetical protein
MPTQHEGVRRPSRWLTAVFFLTFAFVTASATTARAAPILLGNTFPGVLSDVNIATGATTNPRDTGITNLMGIAFSPTGTLFGLTALFSSGTPNALYTFDTATGAPTLVGSTGLTLAEGDLAFDPTTGTLYGYGGLSFPDRTLFTINPATGAATTIGVLGIVNTNDLSAMAFDTAGNLFILDTAVASLLRVNKATGATLGSIPLSIGSLGPLAGLAFDPVTGIAYFANGGGSTNNLYTLDTTTGALTLIGPNAGLAGLAFAPARTVVPEPGTLVLFGVGLVTLMARRRIR